MSKLYSEIYKKLESDGFYQFNTQRKVKPVRWKVNKNGCWICVSHCKDGKGYPILGRNRKNVLLSRYMYEYVTGTELLKSDFIMHRCDNPACINPLHLFRGTHQENMKDMVRKGRQAKGVKNGRAKLTEEQVIKIRQDSRPSRAIAKEYGVSKTEILGIRNGKFWRCVS